MSTPEPNEPARPPYAAPQLTTELLRGIHKNGPTDPIEFYRRPLVGHLFRERINRALRLLPPQRLGKVLEVGYGSGAVQLALSGAADELSGIDLDADPTPVLSMLAKKGRRATLRKGNVLDLPYGVASFDLVVCFSVLEHIHEYDRAISQIARVLVPSGHFLLGMPAVNDMMSLGFSAIGFRGIGHHHVTKPESVAACFAKHGLSVVSTAHLDLPPKGPLHVRVYYNWLLRKR